VGEFLYAIHAVSLKAFAQDASLFKSFVGGGIVQATVIFDGIIIGERPRLECKVRATKTTLGGDPPIFSDYRIVDSDATDRLPDGNYDLLANGERTRLRRHSGRFLSRP
jgi:hypothetical protein